MRAHELSLALWDTRALSAWHGGAGRESSIYVQPLDPLGRLEGAPIRVSDGPDAAFEPDLVAGESGMAIAWYQRARRSGDLSAWLAGLLPGGERQWIVPLTAGGEQARNPVVRFIDETLHVAWIEQGRSSEEGAAIWYQRFSSAGEAL
ncbi:MAG TPA: hypothetical protein GX696_01830, partial [Pseudomonadaceae bacterium]|nr:hypothetical protein [Pseudomonadaceae bacterium]